MAIRLQAVSPGTETGCLARAKTIFLLCRAQTVSAGHENILSSHAERLFCINSNDPLVEVFPLLGRYAALVGSWSPTYQDCLSVPSSRADESKESFLDCFTA